MFTASSHWTKKQEVLELFRRLVVEPAETGASQAPEDSRTAYGFVHLDEATLAAYFVIWTDGWSGPEARFDLIIGRWGEGSRAEDRDAVSLAYRWIGENPTFQVIDAPGRAFAHNELVGRALRREDVEGRPIATQVYAVADAVLFHDPRMSELMGRSGQPVQ